MKQIQFIIQLSVLMAFVSCNSQDKKMQIGKSTYQIELNNSYKDASKSPLKPKDLKDFKGLDFFEIDSTFIVNATLQKIENAPIFQMQTTTDRKPLYKKYGILTFIIKEKKYQLTVYQSQDNLTDPTYKDYLFLPFTDSTNGKESYDGGRYMDLKTYDFDSKGNVTLNFNNTYNPYCAYNDSYSCPVVPKENHIDIKVTAGVKKFKKY